MENVGKVIPGESSQELVESSIHQQDKHSGAGNRQGRVESLGDLYGWTWYGEVGKHLADEDIVTEEGDCLREDRIVVVEGVTVQMDPYPFPPHVTLLHACLPVHHLACNP